MKRTESCWDLVLVVLGALLPLLALACNSTKQTERRSIYEVDRTGTVARITPPSLPPYASQNRRDAESDHDRLADTNKGRIDETSRR